MTVRRLHALVSGLPPEAATWRGRPESWTARDEAAAVAVELTDFWGRQLAVLLGASTNRVKQLPPVQFPRPETEPKRKTHWARQHAQEFQSKLKGGE